uniref:Transmembrane protein 14C n=1 Tax=Sus scrofa TaxID=9823 RepID=A0A8D1NXF4_PIG
MIQGLSRSENKLKGNFRRTNRRKRVQDSRCRPSGRRCRTLYNHSSLVVPYLAARWLSQDSRNIWIFLVTTGTMAGIMGMRFYQSGNFMPAGLTAGASLLMILNLGISLTATQDP